VNDRIATCRTGVPLGKGLRHCLPTTFNHRCCEGFLSLCFCRRAYGRHLHHQTIAVRCQRPVFVGAGSSDRAPKLSNQSECTELDLYLLEIRISCMHVQKADPTIYAPALIYKCLSQSPGSPQAGRVIRSMNTYGKIADGLAAWLTFEHRCGRANLFSEASLAHPLGNLLQYRFDGRVLAEVEHSVLAPLQTTRGSKPRVDFAITGPDSIFDLVVEAKWASNSPTLPSDFLRDIVRLDLMRRAHAREALLLLAGEQRKIRKLFRRPAFSPHPNPSAETYRHRGNEYLLPIGDNRKASVRFAPVSPHRRAVIVKALQPFTSIPVSRSVQIERIGPFPRNATARSYEVYFWRVNSTNDKFIPREEYPELERLLQGGSRTKRITL